MATEVRDFEQEVLARSYEKPVLVDFWAPWCGPCRMLGPVLEKLDAESDRWELAKLNTDENPAVSQRYSIMSIPAVKLFSNGEVVDEFIGALPEPQVRSWLDNALPSENADTIEEARATLRQDPETALTLLRSVLDKEPENATARSLTALALATTDPQQALKVLEGANLRDTEPIRIHEAVKTLAHLSAVRQEPQRLAEEPGAPAYLEAAELVSQQRFEDAFGKLVNVVRVNRKLDDDGARRACLALFTLLGDDDPLAKKYQRQLEMALF